MLPELKKRKLLDFFCLEECLGRFKKDKIIWSFMLPSIYKFSVPFYSFYLGRRADIKSDMAKSIAKA